MHNYEFHIKRIKKSRSDLLARRDQLISQIENVFHSVTREGGISLREGAVIDDYGSDKERTEARELETDSHWSQVNVEELDPGGCCLLFIDPVGFRYYVPAYIVYTLKHAYGDLLGEQSTDSNIFESFINILNATNYGNDNHVAHQPKLFTLFSAKERTCIARFLAFDAECCLDIDDASSIDALKSDWIDSLPDMELKHLKTIWPNAF